MLYPNRFRKQSGSRLSLLFYQELHYWISQGSQSTYEIWEMTFSIALVTTVLWKMNISMGFIQFIAMPLSIPGFEIIVKILKYINSYGGLWATTKAILLLGRWPP